ncbi:MAG: phenylacetate--CoA ligase family protein, partial [Alphaproteobacteria bacterium]
MNYYDDLETRSVETRNADLLAKLKHHISHAKTNTTYFAETLKDVDPESITALEHLTSLPVLKKSDLPDLQPKSLPFGGMNA